MTTLTARPDFVAGTWKLDPSHSEVAFAVRHLAISKVRGTFETFDVTIVTAEDPADTSIEAVIDVASVNTKNADRDGHLRTGDFFLAEEHPQMTFVSKGAPVVDGDDFEISGELTLRGVTKPVTLKGEIGGVTTDPWGGTRAGATATAKINRHDFGVSWNTALETGGFMLGDDVTISLDLQVVLEK
ncbi:YceI family protein [Homoserinibacter sp. YIM 151385]|uniref:YceI family protein n=1 Tax=Homoserinibacter sp. YIM 151385 TaxID=2985506 RepID=UPI0022F1337F|nr:YceI family protein [Homoserinibacter sp. YIM 151385]WBU38300.1 YceI family protein [Homoserinibacter sp. YIM 151385]